MKNNTLSPLFLRSSVAGPFTSLGNGGSAVPLHIKNPNRTAMLVDQLRVTATGSWANYGSGEALSLSLHALCGMSAEVLLGAIPLTNGFVTLGALCPGYFGPNAAAAAASGLVAGEPGGDRLLVWHFAKPLYVPPDVQMSINFKRLPMWPSYNEVYDGNINVSVVGRSLPDDYPVPGEVDVPWVTEMRCDTNVTRYVSNDSDLVNKNRVPLDVHQLVGVNFNQQADDANPAPMTVQMSASNGTMIIRDAVPFFLCFPTERRVLPLSARLQPGEFLRGELEIPPARVADFGDFARCSFTAIAMHGTRKIQTPGTLG